MAVSEKITCDVCGTQKQESNHWVMYDPEIDGETGGVGVCFFAWSSAYANFNHLCGEACAGKLLAQEINKWRSQ